MVSRRSKRTDKALTCVAYMRVSTDDQLLSPEGQRADIEAWASREGYTVVAWHLDDGVSGGLEIDQRPALAAAMRDVAEGRATALVVTKRDRLARDAFVAAVIERELAKSKGRVLTTTGAGNGDSSADRMMRSMLDNFAEFERAQIKERTKRALQVKKARGELTGSAPYGQRVAEDGVHLEPNPEEQKAMARAAELAATLTVRALTEALNAEGFRTRAGTPWTHQGVHRWLRPLLDRAAE